MARWPTSSSRALAFLAGLVAAASSHYALGHSLLVVPQPRDQQDGYKDPPRAPPGTGAPCGMGRMIPPQPETAYSSGQPLHVQWSETIDHPGCFVIDFAAADDANFQILGVKSHAAASGATPRAWSLDVTLPNVSCDACTVRLRQLMLGADVPESGCPPATIPSGSTYYSCANVTLVGGPAFDGSSAGGQTSGSGAGGGGSGGGSGCTISEAPASWPGILLVLAALIARRRGFRA